MIETPQLQSLVVSHAAVDITRIIGEMKASIVAMRTILLRIESNANAMRAEIRAMLAEDRPK